MGDMELLLRIPKYLYSAMATTSSSVLRMNRRNAERHFLGMHGKRGTAVSKMNKLMKFGLCEETLNTLNSRRMMLSPDVMGVFEQRRKLMEQLRTQLVIECKFQFEDRNRFKEKTPVRNVNNGFYPPKIKSMDPNVAKVEFFDARRLPKLPKKKGKDRKKVQSSTLTKYSNTATKVVNPMDEIASSSTKPFPRVNPMMIDELAVSRSELLTKFKLKANNDDMNDYEMMIKNELIVEKRRLAELFNQASLFIRKISEPKSETMEKNKHQEDVIENNKVSFISSRNLL